MLTFHLFVFQGKAPNSYSATRMITRGRRKPNIDALRPKAIPLNAKIVLQVFARGDPIRALRRVDEKALAATKKRRISRVVGLHVL
jgi:hypothetical protein